MLRAARWRALALALAAAALLVGSTTDLSAQAAQFRHLGTDEGLPGAWVTAILQDHTGYMWFGTANGLGRYDGVTLRTYQRRPNDPHALPDNKVNALLEDTRGTLWVGTTALSRYDPARDGFVQYLLADPGHVGRFINSLLEDSRGRFWVGTNFGVYRFDRASGREQRLSLPWPEDPARGSQRVLLEDRRHHLWIAGERQGLADYDPVTGAFRIFRRDGRPGSLPDENVRAMREDRAGRLWLGTGSAGLVQLDPATGRFRGYGLGEPGTLASNGIRALLPDGAGGLWLATERGLSRFDPGTGRFVDYRADPRNPADLNDASIWSLCRDASGILWVGTFAGGLDLLSPQGDAVRLYQTIAGDNSSLANPFVQGFAQDSAGAVWVADGLGGVNRFDPLTGRFARFNRQPDGLNVLAVAPDRDGTVWAGTWDGGLARLDPRSGTFTSLTTRNSNIPTNRLFAVLVDRGGTLWVGTLDSGLLRFDRARQTFVQYPIARAGEGQSQIWQIVELADGRLALATLENGLILFDPRTGAMHTYWAQRGRADALGSDQVRSLLETGPGILWIGTTAGLDRLDLGTGRVSHVTEAQGLPSAVVSGLATDAAGNLWISTVKGIVRFRPGVGPTRYFTSSDGLQASEFNPHAALRLRDGTLLFGGTAGLNVIRPDRLVRNQHRPPVVLTRLDLFNRPVVVGGPGSPLERAIGETRHLTLRHDQSMFTLGFAALDYVASSRNQYAYKLEGFDRDWVHVGSAHAASYAGLPPGDYVFRVIASNNDGLWNQAGASLRVTIEPPLTGTWWFRLLVAALITGSAALVIFNARRRHLLLTSMHARLAAAAERDRNAEQDLERNVLEVLADMRRSVAGGDSLPVPVESDEAIGALRRGIGDILADRRRAEEELRQSQKLEAVGRLAEGAAHDFDDLLTEINRDLALALEGARGQPAVRQELEEVRRAADNAGSLTRQLLALGRKQQLQPRLLSLNALIQDTAHVLAGTAGQGVQLVMRLDYALGRVRADRGQLEQILLNLVVYARDAMPAGGTIVIQTRNLAGATVPQAGARNEQPYVALSIRHTGPRMAADMRDQISDPFSAPPEGGKGIGLGLLSVHSAVERNGGFLHVDSEPGLGTTLTVYLPRTDEDVSAEPEGDGPAPNAAATARRQTVLLVEDDDAQRHRALGVLQGAGYIVLAAYSGANALKLATEYGGPVDLLLTTVLMPGMSGRELAERLLPKRPDMHVLYTFGYMEDAIVRRADTAGIAFLQKPFTADQLLETVRELLRSPSEADVAAAPRPDSAGSGA